MGTVWRQGWVFQKRQCAKCQWTARTTTHIADKALARAHAHLRGYYSLLHYRNVRRAGPGHRARKVRKTHGPGTKHRKKFDTSPFWSIEPPVRDIATTKEKDHIALHRHLRKRLDFYPGEARARRYKTGPPPVPPDMAGGSSAFAVM